MSVSMLLTRQVDRINLRAVRGFSASVRKLEWSVSGEIRDKKSVFVARAMEVRSAERAKDEIEQLKKGHKKIAKATHNITAWRIQQDSSFIQDSNDDGEDAAGDRLLRLLCVSDF